MSGVDEEILQELKEIKVILQRLLTKRTADLDLPDWVSLPDHLRKTFVVCLRKNFVTAYDVVDETGRARAVESGYLNQLVTMGYLKKKRRGRLAVFEVLDI